MNKIILRKGIKENYYYENEKGKLIKDKQILEYIKKLVIPPNYNNVKIFYEKNPKILYQGFDNKNRLQRIYSSEWTKKASLKKICNLINITKHIEKINRITKKEILKKKITKNKCISLIIRLVIICHFRIGNKKYQDLYGSFGAMNIQKKHISFKKNKNNIEYMFISFKGKKGIINNCDIYDKILIEEIKKILINRKNNELVFKWYSNGNYIPIKAIDINNWLKKINEHITSKDFRTYYSNILLLDYLKKETKPIELKQNKRKKNIINALKDISEKIHNTPSILKKNYIINTIIDIYIDNPKKYIKYFINSNTSRQNLLNYLLKYCKNT